MSYMKSPVIKCHIMRYIVKSWDVMLCLVISYDVTVCDVWWYHTIFNAVSCHILWCCVMPCDFTVCDVSWNHVILWYYVMSQSVWILSLCNLCNTMYSSLSHGQISYVETTCLNRHDIMKCHVAQCHGISGNMTSQNVMMRNIYLPVCNWCTMFCTWRSWWSCVQKSIFKIKAIWWEVWRMDTGILIAD